METTGKKEVTETTGKKVKNILLRLKIKGNGIVNYDGGDRKWLYINGNLKRLKVDGQYNNTTFAKSNVYEDADGNMVAKLKISSDCLKHSIFEKEIPVQSPNVSHNEDVLYSFIGSPAYILRGGFFEFGKGESSFKRKAPFQLSDAEQIVNSDGLMALSTIETFSRSGKKRTDNTIDDKADSTFFKKETVGKIEYYAEGNVDLEQLQFVSTDIIFDRLAFSGDKFELFSSFLKSRIENFNSELGYYKMVNSRVAIPEYGFKFSDENILSLVKHQFMSILELNIRRKSSSAITSEFQYKLVYTPSKDTMYNEDGWVSVNNISDIESINFEPENFYVLENEEVSVKLRSDIEENSKKQDSKSSAVKQKIKDAVEVKKNKSKKKDNIVEADVIEKAVEELETAEKEN